MASKLTLLKVRNSMWKIPSSSFAIFPHLHRFFCPIMFILTMLPSYCAKAALLIQGSAAIYSKKVEYLYGLIFKTLEQVSQQEYVRKMQLQIKPFRNADANFACLVI